MSTKNIVPKQNNQGSLGTDLKQWAAAHVQTLKVDGLDVALKNQNVSLFVNDAGYITVADIPVVPVLSVAGRTGNVVLVKGDVALGNVENTALSTWAGTTNITTLGTIGAGTWQGSSIADAYLTALTATKLTGTISDARLSSNVALLNASNIFTAKQIVRLTTNQFEWGYDSGNYLRLTIDSTGNASFSATGTNANITLTPTGTGQVITPNVLKAPQIWANVSNNGGQSGVGIVTNGLYLTGAGLYTDSTGILIKESGLFLGSNKLASWGPYSFANENASDISLGRNDVGTLEINSGTIGAYRDLKLRSLRPIAGTTNSAPIFLTAGTNLTTLVNGAIEYNGSHLYITISGTRYQLDQQSGGGGGLTHWTEDSSSPYNIIPNTDASSSLGSVTNRIHTAFFENGIYIGTAGTYLNDGVLRLGNSAGQIQVSGTELHYGSAGTTSKHHFDIGGTEAFSITSALSDGILKISSHALSLASGADGLALISGATGTLDLSNTTLTLPTMTIQVRRGLATDLAVITPVEGEPCYTTDTKEFKLGDGSTLGGVSVNNKFSDNASTPTNTGTIAGWTKIKINGTDAWLPYYQ